MMRLTKDIVSKFLVLMINLIPDKSVMFAVTSMLVVAWSSQSSKTPVIRRRWILFM